MKHLTSAALTKNYSTFTTNTFQSTFNLVQSNQLTKSSILSQCQTLLSPLNQPATATTSNIQVRTVTKFSLNKGKRKTVKAVIKRFKRLHWGAWIRTRCGRHKKMFKKSAARKRRLRQHIFTNATQSWLLDKMVTKYWKRPKYYVDDPYEPYHKRENFPFARSKPVKYYK